MSQVVLPQQILAIVVSIRRSHHAMDMLLGRLLAVGGKTPQICRTLVVEFDQDHRTLHPVIEDAVGLRAANPGEPCVVEMTVDFVHFHARVTVVHVADVQVDKVAQALPRWSC